MNLYKELGLDIVIEKIILFKNVKNLNRFYFCVNIIVLI